VKIGEFAGEGGCDVQTVRFYEREGLLEKPPRDASGYRYYGQRHVTQLRFIRHLRTLDIPLPEVRQLLEFAARPDDPSCGQVNDLLDTHIGLVKQRIQALKALEKQLAALRKTCAGDSSHCAILDSFISAAEQHACACHDGGPRAAPADRAPPATARPDG